jgi:hypothetical protein
MTRKQLQEAALQNLNGVSRRRRNQLRTVNRTDGQRERPSATLQPVNLHLDRSQFDWLRLQLPHDKCIRSDIETVHSCPIPKGMNQNFVGTAGEPDTERTPNIGSEPTIKLQHFSPSSRNTLPCGPIDDLATNDVLLCRPEPWD